MASHSHLRQRLVCPRCGSLLGCGGGLPPARQQEVPALPGHGESLQRSGGPAPLLALDCQTESKMPGQTRPDRQGRNFLCLDHIQTSRGSRETQGLWRSSHRGQVRADCPPLRLLGPQRGRGGRAAGGGVAREPRQGGPGRPQDPSEEDHHQAGLPGSHLRQVRSLGGCTARWECFMSSLPPWLRSSHHHSRRIIIIIFYCS